MIALLDGHQAGNHWLLCGGKKAGLAMMAILVVFPMFPGCLSNLDLRVVPCNDQCLTFA